MRAGNLHGQLMAQGLQSVWKRHEACNNVEHIFRYYDNREVVKRFLRSTLGNY
jgi:hypothetical protein